MHSVRPFARFLGLILTLLVLLWYNTSAVRFRSISEISYDEWRASLRPLPVPAPQLEVRAHLRLEGTESDYRVASQDAPLGETSDSTDRVLRLIDLLAEVPDALKAAPSTPNSADGLAVEVLQGETTKFHGFIPRESIEDNVQSQNFVRLVQLFASAQKHSSTDSEGESS